MICDNPNHRPVVAAALAASFLMLIGGLTYRHLATPVDKIPIDPDIMQTFPLQFGDWSGEDVPMDEAIVRATETDAHINRRYSRVNGLESVSLYIACGVYAQHVMSHRPQVCYVGAGWTLADQHSTEFPLNDGMKLPCSILQFTRGVLDTKRVTVLNYFIVDGQYCGDVSLLQSKAWHNFRAVGYAVQVQIVSSAESLSGNPTTRLICDFAVDSASSIAELVDRIQKDRIEHSTDPLKEESSS